MDLSLLDYYDEVNGEKERDLQWLHKSNPKQATKCTNVTQGNNHAFNNSRKIVRSIDKLWKIIPINMRLKSQDILEIFSKPCVQHAQVIRSPRLAQTSNHYKDTFKDRFKIDSKSTTKARMKA